MKKDSFSEKRKHSRFPGNIKIDLQLHDKTNPEVITEKITATAKNISEEGVCFISPKTLEPETLLTLDIFFPLEPEPLHIHGQVIWSCALRSHNGDEVFEVGAQLFYNKQSWNIDS